MLADQVRAAAASGHSQDLARLLANPDPNKFAPDLVLHTFSVLTFNTVNRLSIRRPDLYNIVYIDLYNTNPLYTLKLFVIVS